MTVDIPASGRTLLDRLERLPLSRPHLMLLLIAGLGIAFDGMDGSLVSYLLPAVKPLWHLAPWQIGLIGSSLLIGILVGALGAGIIGDAIGRRAVMMYALALYCGATLIAAFAPSWELFFGARIVAGIGVGAEAAIIPAFIAEFIPARSRGLLVGAVAGFFSAGYVVSALLGRLFVPAFGNGWRVAQVLTALPVLMLLWWRRGLPESPRWLIQQGRYAEAGAVVDALEDAVRASGKDVPPVPAQAPQTTLSVPRATKPGAGLILMWRDGLARRTAVLWLLWISITFAFYGFFTWIPSLLVERDLTISKSLSYALLITIAQIPGYYSGAYLNERLDRKWTIAFYLTAGSVSALLMANAGSNGQLLVYGILLSFFMNGTYAGLYAYTPEVYPTAIRATGMGTASAVGRLGGISAPILIGVLITSIGFLGVFSMIAAALLLGALAILTLGLSTRGRRLEDLDPEQAVGHPGPAVASEAVN
ncbi:MFS transporter [Kribbella sp.]|uniref:MFS transporter n=1 Tax=Kribbella sp. TaxID=1871183 RepID=UPI002D4DAC91|nr:MFS transporter [Kribbella sp.]HZX03085.1 MFS transporter [Kribbella sp.]